MRARRCPRHAARAPRRAAAHRAAAHRTALAPASPLPHPHPPTLCRPCPPPHGTTTWHHHMAPPHGTSTWHLHMAPHGTSTWHHHPWQACSASRSRPLYLPTSPHISPHLPTSPHISPHLPTSPHISPHLPQACSASRSCLSSAGGGAASSSTSPRCRRSTRRSPATFPLHLPYISPKSPHRRRTRRSPLRASAS